MRSEQGSDCSNLYLMKISSLDPKNILLRDQRVVKMHLFFTRKMMVGSNFLLVIHIPQGMEVSKSTDVFRPLYSCIYQSIFIEKYPKYFINKVSWEKYPFEKVWAQSTLITRFNTIIGWQIRAFQLSSRLFSGDGTSTSLGDELILLL